jgi:hypothetical protein
MAIPQLAPELSPDEPLSPEIVLVLPPALRAEALAALGPPVWPTPAPRLRLYVPAAPRVPVEEPVEEPLEEPVEEPVDEPVEEPPGRALGRLLARRVLSLGLIFVVATVLTIALSLVARALH